MKKNDFKKSLKKVHQIKINKDSTIQDIIEGLKDTGFNAKRLALGCEIYETMIKDADCVKFFGLAGAIVPCGLQGIIHDFVEEGFIDILVTTGANLTHDLAETLGYHHLQGDMNVEEINDSRLHEEALNRIYDVFLPNQAYEGIEDFISNLSIREEQMTVSSFLKLLGEKLPENDKSILKICARRNVPIFCPAFTDSGLALQLGFHHPNVNLNHMKDMLTMVDLAWEAKKAGICIVGGGVPKNFILQSLQFSPNAALYAIQITMDRPEPGGLSGASLKEAISWGKLNEKALYSTIISDASIALPLMLWYLKQAFNR
ncbi:MAG: deoxyhypusine synthase family protein [Promethearchaeota archaeon]